MLTISKLLSGVPFPDSFTLIRIAKLVTYLAFNVAQCFSARVTTHYCCISFESSLPSNLVSAVNVFSQHLNMHANLGTLLAGFATGYILRTLSL